MSINYTYQIVSVDEAARCMEVVYTSEGRQTMRIGARLPFEGEVLENIVRMFEPVALWQELAAAVVVPEVGTSGVIISDAPSPVQAAIQATSASIPTAVL